MLKKIKTNENREFRVAEKNIIENPADIIYCQAYDHYINIYYKNGKRITRKYCLKNVKNMLGRKMFFSTHRSVIINLRYVKCYYKNGRGLIAELENGIKIPVSRWLKKDFEKLVSRFPTIKRV